MAQILTVTPMPGETDAAFAARFAAESADFFGTDSSAPDAPADVPADVPSDQAAPTEGG